MLQLIPPPCVELRTCSLRSGSKAYVEIRLRETTRRFVPVDVDSETGEMSYEHTDGIAIKASSDWPGDYNEECNRPLIPMDACCARGPVVGIDECGQEIRVCVLY